MTRKSAEIPLHAGHRQRLKARFLRDPHSVEEYELLELLLGYALLRKDTKPLAKQLLLHFGCLGAVLKARQEELEQFAGFGQGTWTLWQVFRECMARTAAAPFAAKAVMDSPEAVVKAARQRFAGLSHEECWIVLVDRGKRCIGWERLVQGSLAAIPITPRDILAKVLERKADGFYLLHNHPSGNAKPSREDLVLTELLRQLSPPMDVAFLEHIIITEKECRSIIFGYSFS